jgi:hypothetical protein
MKKAGVLLIVLGIVSVFLAFNMDVVVGTSYNIGLLNERQNIVYLSGILFLAGIILFGFGVVVKEESENFQQFSLWILLIPIALLAIIQIFSYVQSKWSELKDEEVAEEDRHTLMEIRKTKKIAMEKDKDKFIDNKNGTVTFKSNGLMWQKCSIGLTWNGVSCTGDIREITWNEATTLSSNFAGYKDWRLPTKEELMTLIYCHKKYNNSNGMCDNDDKDDNDDDFIAINDFIFSDVREFLYKISEPYKPPEPYPYWTSTPYDVSVSYLVDELSCIDFNRFGIVDMCSKNNEDRGFVRLVRESDKM